MLLEKWYLDAVFPDGTVWFGYRARLRLWRWLSIPWASGCELQPDGRARTVAPWKVLPEPRLRAGRWHWQGPDGFQARWAPVCRAVESPLGSDDQFRVRWNCLAPRATVTRVVADGAGRARAGAPAHGTGYLEHLQIQTTGPHPPFRELWWGHAAAGDSSLVWIRWKGGRDLGLVFEDGMLVPGKIEVGSAYTNRTNLHEAKGPQRLGGPATIPGGGARIETGRGIWQTECGRVLCDRDVRRAFPRWLVWLAGGMAPAREVKMAGSVRLRSGSGEFTGAGVWEEVQWP
jgi:hypothetical protein